jgi:hypothetical protein
VRPRPVDASSDIEAAAKTLLRGSKALGVYPTPVERIIAEAELKVEEGVDLSRVRPGFFTKTFEGIGRVSRSVLGLLDYREKLIYLDLSQKEPRQRFIKLHEVGHNVLPWQADAYRWDDAKTLDPGTTEGFEREASFFASCALFQLDRFDEEAAKLPLGIISALALGKKFGASCQAAIRRYVQHSKKRCAVLVLEPLNDDLDAKVRDCFESPAFAAEFGELPWPEYCDASLPFVQDMLRKRRLHEDGDLILQTGTPGGVALEYQYFCNGFNSFVFLFPPGECIRSRTRIVLTGSRT